MKSNNKKNNNSNFESKKQKPKVKKHSKIKESIQSTNEV